MAWENQKILHGLLCFWPRRIVVGLLGLDYQLTGGIRPYEVGNNIEEHPKGKKGTSEKKSRVMVGLED